MRKLSLLLVFCFIISSFSLGVNADGLHLDADDTVEIVTEYAQDEVIVFTNYLVNLQAYSSGNNDFHGVTISEIRPLFECETEEQINAWISAFEDSPFFPYLISLSSPNAEAAKELLSEDDLIYSAYLNYVLPEAEITSQETTSDVMNAISSGLDWAFEYLDIEACWNYGFVGSSDVKVAVIEYGFNLSHTDLENNVVDSLAYDAYDGDSDVYCVGEPDDPQYYNRHGNGVAGIIGADNDDIGVSGICQNISIIPIKNYPTEPGEGEEVPDEQYDDILVSAVAKAITRGAKIINLSQTYTLERSEQIIALAEATNSIIITSAGNSDYAEIDTYDEYAGLRNNSLAMVVVSSVNSNMTLASGALTSSTYVDLMAPGENIYLVSSEGYHTDSGTSFAAPYVTAAFALIHSHAPHLSFAEIRELLLDNVTEVDALDGLCATGGVLSIKNAILALYNENRGAYTKGDIDGDGYITSQDYVLCKRIYNETIVPTESQLSAADVNGDGSITSADSDLIKQFAFKTNYFSPY